MNKTSTVNTKKLLTHRRVALSLLLLAALNVHAQVTTATTKPCIELKNEAQVQEHYTDAQGKQASRLVAPGKVIPGNEIVYTITAANVCDKPVNAVVINNAVPEHMSYVMNSAMGVGTDISYSIDGKNFAKLEALSIKNAEGVAHAPNGEDIKSIRWVYATAINPGQSGFVRFRATVK
jgi:uncharacterized repeat protein (TIGR01451 family)